jgi:hypothetical protein
MEQDANAMPSASGKLVVVLGMHRSGTSAITRALAALGAELGNRLLAPLPGVNDKGFFEDYDILLINHELLGAAGLEWHTLGQIDLSRIGTQQLAAFRARAVATLRAKCAGRTFALKDPRLARLMPFWQPIFDEIGIPVTYVIAVRNPISVVKSLAKRDSMSEDKSYLLWLSHVVPSLIDTQQKPRAFIDYDRMLDDPSCALADLSRRLELPLDANSADEFSRSFLEAGLRHTRFSAADLSAVPTVPGAVKQLFAALDQVCRTGEEDPALQMALDCGQQLLVDVEPLLRYQQQVDRQLAQTAAVIEQANQILLERDKRIAELERTIQGMAAGNSIASEPIRAAATAVTAAPVAAGISFADAARATLAKPARKTIYSFVVSAAQQSAYQGYQLARSLIQHGCSNAADVNVQFMDDVGVETRQLFRDLGCTEHAIDRFGDGRYCNKIALLANLKPIDFDHVVLLDTNMIAIGDPRPYLCDDALMAKVVDLPQPPAHILDEIARLAGMNHLPPMGRVDATHLPTYVGNCNGGFWGIPKALAVRVDDAWRRWALWLLDHMEPLTRSGTRDSFEQVAMWLAIIMDRIPYRAAPSNVNYYVHFDGEHHYFDPKSDIVLLHYGDASLNALGKLESRPALNTLGRDAIAKANEQIGADL